MTSALTPTAGATLGIAKNNPKKTKKSIDKPQGLWYNKSTKEVLDWFLDAKAVRLRVTNLGGTDGGSSPLTSF